MRGVAGKGRKVDVPVAHVVCLAAVGLDAGCFVLLLRGGKWSPVVL